MCLARQRRYLQCAQTSTHPGTQTDSRIQDLKALRLPNWILLQEINPSFLMTLSYLIFTNLNSSAHKEYLLSLQVEVKKFMNLFGISISPNWGDTKYFSMSNFLDWSFKGREYHLIPCQKLALKIIVLKHYSKKKIKFRIS